MGGLKRYEDPSECICASPSPYTCKLDSKQQKRVVLKGRPMSYYRHSNSRKITNAKARYCKTLGRKSLISADRNRLISDAILA